MFLKVKGIVEARLEHLSGVHIEAKNCVWNPVVPNSLFDAVDEIIKNETLSLRLHLAINSWKTFFPEL